MELSSYQIKAILRHIPGILHVLYLGNNKYVFNYKKENGTSYQTRMIIQKKQYVPIHLRHLSMESLFFVKTEIERSVRKHIEMRNIFGRKEEYKEENIEWM
jgi:hypothetical protein